MKRKFSFNLSPIHVPSSSELKSLSKNSTRNMLASPPSPRIERRSLSPNTEAELRLACQAFAKYNQGDDEPSKLDFELVHRYMKDKQPTRTRHHPQSESKKYKDHKDDSASRKRHSQRSDAPVAKPSSATIAPATFPANVGYRRDTPSPLKSTRNDKSQYSRKESVEHERTRGSEDRHRLHVISHAVDSDDSYSTPVTGSTDAAYHHGSTAMTSLASPNRDSQADPKSHSARDLETARLTKEALELQKLDMERRRQKVAANLKQSTEELRSSSRQMSRNRSFRGELREYFRPGSAQSKHSKLSRSSSKDSMRDEESKGTHIWKSWSLRRKSSENSMNNSRPGSSRGRQDSQQVDQAAEPMKPAVNLNRELPPLPGLDQWKGEEAQDQETKPHIAQLMVHTDSQKPKVELNTGGTVTRPPKEKSKGKHTTRPLNAESNGTEAARKKSHRRSMTMPDLKDAKPITVNKENAKPTQAGSKEFDFDALLTAMERTEIGQDWTKPQPRDRSKSPAVDGFRASPMLKHSLDQGRNEIPNFSRKISCEVTHGQDTEPTFSQSENVNNAKHAKGFRKVFGGLFGGKNNRKNPPNTAQQPVAKQGFLLHDEAASAPVIRY